jgi:glucose-1-phosphate thymidylyltransferase
MNEASNYVRSIEMSIDFKIGCIEEIAYRQNWIDQEQLKKIIESLGKNEYANYLTRVAENPSNHVR